MNPDCEDGISSAKTETTVDFETYETAGYKKFSHGFNYQLKLLMLVLLRACSTYSKFKLATEMAAAKQFDDIVLDYESKDGHNVIVFIQCKHKESEEKTIKLDDFSKEKGPYCLTNHLMSFVSTNNDKTFSPKTIKSFILYTNIDIDEKLKIDQMYVEEATEDKTLEILRFKSFKKTNNDVPKFYNIRNMRQLIKTMKKYVAEEHKRKTDIKEFEEKFLLATNQPNEKELEKIIMAEMGGKVGIADRQRLYEALYFYVHRWMSNKEGKVITKAEGDAFLNDFRKEMKEAKVKLGAEIKGAVFVNQEKRLDFGLFFKTTINLENMLSSSQAPMVHIKSESPSLTIIKIVQSMKDKTNFVALNLNTLLHVALANNVKEAFTAQSEFTVYIECTSLDEQPIVEAKRLLGELQQCTSSGNCKKRLILVSHAQNDLAKSLVEGNDYAPLEDRSSYEDLIQDAKERVLNYKVNFQGENVQLRDIVNGKDYFALDEDTLNKIIEKEEITIGKALPTTEAFENFHIKRRKDVNKSMIRKKHKDMSEDELNNIKKTRSANNMCIIEGAPGIGKSTELISMAHQNKTDNNTNFLIHLNLFDITSEFKEQHIDKDTVLQSLSKIEGIETNFGKQILEHHLFHSGKITIYLDGLDEVSPSQRALTIGFIKFLKNETQVTKIWLAARPHLANILVEEFEPVFYQLQLFNEAEQKEFLTKFWSYSLKATDHEHIDVYADKLLKGVNNSDVEAITKFTGNPLQIKMTAEVFEEQCKTYRESKGECEMKFTNMNMYDLFKNSINKKFEIDYKEKIKMDLTNERVKKIVAGPIRLSKIEHQKLAFKLTFPNECDLFKESIGTVDDNDLLSVGILHKNNNSVMFVHHTFAEYFLAKFLVEKLQKDQNEEFLQFLNLYYFRNDNQMVRYFMDHILAKKSKIHMAVIENKLDTVKKLINTDESLLLMKDALGRIPLHLSCLYSTFHSQDNTDLGFPITNTLEFLISKDIGEDDPSQIAVLDMFKYAPYAYASISKCNMQAWALLTWHYYQFHLQKSGELDAISKQVMNVLLISQGQCSIEFPPMKNIKFTTSGNSMDKIIGNSISFKAAKPYFYSHETITEVCQPNNHEIVMHALTSYFADVVCLQLREDKYLEPMKNSLVDLKLCKNWLEEALRTMNFPFMLGITLAFPEISSEFWKEEGKIELLNVFPKGSYWGKITSSFKKKKNELFLSDNNFKKYLVLAIRQLLIQRINNRILSIDFIDYFQKTAMEDYNSFKVSLRLMSNEDKAKIFVALDEKIEHDVLIAINQTNSCKLYNALQYFKSVGPVDCVKCAEIHNIMTNNTQATVSYMKDCLKNMDIVGINVLLTYAIRYFCLNRSSPELENIFHETDFSFTAGGKGEVTEAYFINASALGRNVRNKLSHTLDQYASAVIKGYPFSLTQHIISQIAWLNGKEIPSFFPIYFQDNSTKYKYKFTDEIKRQLELRVENVKDIFRYFIFANESQKKVLLQSNNSNIIRFLERKIQLGEMACNVITSMNEYVICLLEALTKRDSLLFSFVKIFVQKDTTLNLVDNPHFLTKLESALKEMNTEWVIKLFQIPCVLEEIRHSDLTYYIDMFLTRNFNENLEDFQTLLNGIIEGEKYWHLALNVDAYQFAVINKDYLRLEFLFKTNRNRWDWLKGMRNSVELENHLTYFHHFCIHQHEAGILALLQFTNYEERMPIEEFICLQKSNSKTNVAVSPKSKPRWDTLQEYLENYEVAIKRGFPLSIFQYVYFCFKCIEERITLPSFINCYLQKDDESAIDFAEQIVELKQAGKDKEFQIALCIAPMEIKKAIVVANDCEILKDALQNDYFENLLLSHDNYGEKLVLDYTHIISEKEILAITLDDYMKQVDQALNKNDVGTLGRLNAFLANNDKSDLWEKLLEKWDFDHGITA